MASARAEMAQCAPWFLIVVGTISRMQPDPLCATGCQMKPVILRSEVLEIKMDRLGEPIGA